MAQIDVKHFNLDSIPARTNSLIFGKRNSGKTTLSINLLSHIHKFYPIGCAIAPTAQVRLELCKHMPSSLVWPEFDIQKLTAVVSKFTESTIPDWMEYSNDSKVETIADILNWLLYMDDCGYSEKTFRHVTFNNMYMNGRQVGQGTLLNLQRIKSIPPQLRGQLDYGFFFRDLSKTVQETIHHEFFSFLKFELFKELYMKCTEGFNCMVLDVARAQRIRDLGNSPKSLTECIFVFSPKPIDQLPPFMMFDKYIWKLDIALKRLYKKRALAHALNAMPASTGFVPRIVSEVAQPVPEEPERELPLPTIHENDRQEPSPKIHSQRRQEPSPKTLKTLSIPKTARYSGYPISTFSSLKAIPSVVPSVMSVLRPSKTQIRNEKKHRVRKHHHRRSVTENVVNRLL